jgi:hypothetical protein
MIMLKLLPEQISRHWDMIKYAIERTTRGGVEPTDEYLTLMAEKLVSGQVQCWATQQQENGNISLMSLTFTSIITDSLTNIRNLIIIGVFAFSSLSDVKLWEFGLTTLRRFAKGNDCKNIVFYTDVPRLVEIAKEFGALTNITYGIIPT